MALARDALLHRGGWVLICLGMLVGLGYGSNLAWAHPISHPSPRVTDVSPLPGSVVGKGSVRITGTAVHDQAVESLTLRVDGVPVDAAIEDGALGGTGIDGTHQRISEILDLAPGRHTAVVTARSGEATETRTWRFDVADVAVRRFAGDTRVGTAAVIAREYVTNRDALAPAAVVARADGFADALAGVPLAHALEGPMLLTSTAELDSLTAAALADNVLPGGTVYLLGGLDAVSLAVEEAIRDLGLRVRRLAGADRYTTSVNIAEAITALTDAPPAVVVASGASFADALTMSVPAARAGWPVVLTAADSIPMSVQTYLSRQDQPDIELVGGTAAVSASTAKALEEFGAVRRTGGADRYATAALISRRFLPAKAGVALASGANFPDALAGGVLAAARGFPVLLAADQRLPRASAGVIAATAPENLIVLGGEAAVPSQVVSGALARTIDTSPAVVEPNLDRAITLEVGATAPPFSMRLPGVILAATSQASMTIADMEVPVEMTVSGDSMTVSAVELPAGLPRNTALDVRLVGALYGTNGEQAHVDEAFALRLVQPLETTPEGYVAISGQGKVVGSTGPIRTYSLEVDATLAADVRGFALEAEQLLSDTRGWTARGERRLRRVPPDQAQIRVLLASPATVDRLCAQAGLNTRGVLSCWNGTFAALNVDRWMTGADGFAAPLEAYRGYLVNHEVGHGLGKRHRTCPSPGALAPVMMQQTKSTGACVPNAWPYP